MKKNFISAIFAYRQAYRKVECNNLTCERKKKETAVVKLTAIKISRLPSVKT